MRKCSYPATCVGYLAKKHLPSCGDDGNLPLVEKKDWMSFRAANLLRVDNVELQRSQNGAKESTKPITLDQNTPEFIKGKSSLVLYH